MQLAFHFAKHEELKRITNAIEITLLLERVRDAYLAANDRDLSLVGPDGTLASHVASDIDTTLRVRHGYECFDIFEQRSLGALYEVRGAHADRSHHECESCNRRAPAGDAAGEWTIFHCVPRSRSGLGCVVRFVPDCSAQGNASVIVALGAVRAEENLHWTSLRLYRHARAAECFRLH